MKNVLIVSLGTFAMGESVIALDLARQLQHNNFNPCLVISNAHKVLLDERHTFPHITLYKNAETINKLLLDDFIAKYPPNLIILSDFFTLESEKKFTGIGLDYFLSLHLPILSIDSYGWEETNFKLDFMDGRISDVPNVLKYLDGMLRPCPLNKPLTTRSSRSVSYRSINNQIIRKRRRDSARKILEIDDDVSVILTANAVWEEVVPRRILKWKWGFLDAIPSLIQSHITRILGTVLWIRVSPKLGEPIERIGN